MKPEKLRLPSVVHHKPTDQDCVFLPSADGRRRMVYLGAHGSAAAARRYREILADFLAGRPISPTTRRDSAPSSKWPTVGHLCAAFLAHAGRYYRDKDGKLSAGVKNFAPAFAPLLHEFRDVPTDHVTVATLVAVRQTMVEAGNLCRVTINGRLALLKQLFKWGTEQQLVPGPTWHELSALRGLPPGRSGVRENPPVEAVPWSLVALTIPHLTPTVRAAVLVQWHTGMRPAELLSMTRRRLTIGKAGEPWVYRPGQHKGAWRGHERLVAIGPKAQDLLRPLLSADPDAALFSPQRAWQEYRQALRTERKTAETKQTKDRDARAEKAEDCAPFFDVPTYRRAIHRACDRAEQPRWSPHRLRHAAGTRLVLQEGLEAARAALGHSDSRMTRRYSTAADAELAVAVAARHG